MSFPRYPAYKNSGAAWLGAVPDHWRVERSVSCLTTTRDSIDVDDLSGTEVFHYSIPAVQDSGGGQLEDGSEIRSAKLQISEPQVLVSKLNPRKGTVCVARPTTALTVCSTEFVPLIPRGVDLQYLFYLAQSEPYRQRLEARVESVTRSHQRVQPEDVVRFSWAFPSSEEQSNIAAFLDRETAKIDALVAEQRRLIDLLQEKRQAVISHAVTKGLNPDAPMKDSGVEWLGEVPAHWVVGPLKRILKTIESGTSVNAIDTPASADELGVLKTSCVYTGRFDASQNKTVIEEERERVSCPLKANTIIVSRMNTPDLVGAAGLVTESASNLFLPDRLWQVSLQGALPRFVHYWTGSTLYREMISAICTGTSSSMKNLGQEQFASLPIALPAEEEQQRIANFLDSVAAMIDDLLGEQHRAITLLLERRAALITAAVTGQIDVRGLAAAEAA